MASNIWQIDGEWLVTARKTRIARITPGGLALWDKAAHEEVMLETADLLELLQPSLPSEADDLRSEP